MPNFAGQGSPLGAQIPAAFMDMLAAALRGGAKATLGMPGDIESLGRAGINWAAPGAVGEKPALPTTEDVGKWLPPLNPMVPMPGGKAHPMEELGQFAPIPGVIEGGIKAAQLVKGLRSGAQATPATAPALDASRRAFLGSSGKAAAGIAATAAMPGVVSKLLREGTSAVPVAPVATAAKTAVKAGAGALSRNAAILASAKSANRFGNGGFLPDDVIPHLAKAYPKATDAELAKIVERLGTIDEQGAHLLAYVDHADTERLASYVGKGTLTRDELAKQGLKTQDQIYDAILTGKLDAKNVHPLALREEWTGGEPSSITRAVRNAEGYGDPYDMIETMSKADMLKYVKEVEAIRKQAGMEPLYDMRIIDQLWKDVK